ncbi:MAG TPA: hypothetical protein VLX91_05580 [Candidatus Acidoferrales bacterium]|nr:hypothetical protein [Candidatus Acidoferrales bacterium]
MSDQETKPESFELLSQILANLEERISRIEQRLNLQPIGLEQKLDAPTADNTPLKETLELQIGLYWFAKVGIVALITGAVFLLLQPYRSISPLFAPALGCALAMAVLLLCRYLSRSSPFIAGYLLGSGLVLLFFATLRLHFLTNDPALKALIVEIALLLFVCAVSLTISLSRKSIYLAAVSLTMGYVTALLANMDLPFFMITAVVAAVTVYLAVKNGWHSLVVYGIVSTYLAHFIWFINNPLIGNRVELRGSSFVAALLVLLWILIFATASYLRGKNIKEDSVILLSSILNCLGGYGLYFIITVTKFQDRLPSSNLIASTLFIILAATYWTQLNSRFRTFFYAMTGYAALSVAIVAGFKTPDFFIWLCWQSLLVVSTAVWFRSKFIVVTNFIIYVLIFLAYLTLAGTVSITGISFGVVALLSARVLNWQRHRLELKTDLMRNAYLVSAFLIIPYALYHTVPTEFVSLSWLGVAIIYYIISLILKNIKYRWMALLTFLGTALYLLVIGTTKLEPVFRIVSFMVLGIVLLVVSFIYARVKMKSNIKKD